MRNLTYQIHGDTAFIDETKGLLTFELTHFKIRIDETHMTLAEKAERWIKENK